LQRCIAAVHPLPQEREPPNVHNRNVPTHLLLRHTMAYIPLVWVARTRNPSLPSSLPPAS